eukprot:scaffold9336_cov133-Isochrysis_galbana.AAC.9
MDEEASREGVNRLDMADRHSDGCFPPNGPLKADTGWVHGVSCLCEHRSEAWRPKAAATFA